MINNNKKSYAVITARGGSKRIKNKNLIDLGGKPLISWTIEAALKSKRIDQIIISTDNENIANIGESYGINTPSLRPQNLSQDHSSHYDVVRYCALDMKKRGHTHSHIVILQPTSPFRESEDIDLAIDLSYSSPVDSVVSVTKVEHHPYLMYKLGENKKLEKYQSDKENQYIRSQDQEHLVALNGAIYCIDIDKLLMRDNLLGKDILPYEMTREKSVDIDTLEDLDFARLIAKSI